jgi:hypothetical protein
VTTGGAQRGRRHGAEASGVAAAHRNRIGNPSSAQQPAPVPQQSASVVQNSGPAPEPACTRR